MMEATPHLLPCQSCLGSTYELQNKTSDLSYKSWFYCLLYWYIGNLLMDREKILWYCLNQSYTSVTGETIGSNTLSIERLLHHDEIAKCNVISCCRISLLQLILQVVVVLDELQQLIFLWQLQVSFHMDCLHFGHLCCECIILYWAVVHLYMQYRCQPLPSVHSLMLHIRPHFERCSAKAINPMVKWKPPKAIFSNCSLKT